MRYDYGHIHHYVLEPLLHSVHCSCYRCCRVVFVSLVYNNAYGRMTVIVHRFAPVVACLSWYPLQCCLQCCLELVW
jgi:hypothetical protein